MALAVSRETARGRHHDYVLPNGTHISLDTYLGKNLVTLASEGGGAPGAQDTGGFYPMAYLVQQSAGSEIQAHYHQADQFQLFVHGSGRIGTHALQGLTLHYAGALSPYGPIVSDGAGLQYLTFRNRWDPGAQWMPGAAQRLRDEPDRRHFAVSRDIEITAGNGPRRQEVIRDGPPGLGAWVLQTGPGGSVTGPSPDEGAGQFWYGLRGEVEFQGKPLGRNGVVFVAPGEPAVEMRAAGEGATLVLMQFPRSPS